MDRIDFPVGIPQSPFVTPRAPHYNEEERKRQHQERQHHEKEESGNESPSDSTPPLKEESPIGTKIDIQI